MSGADVLSQVPAARWLPASLPTSSEQVETRRRHGGFVRSADLFDHVAFGVSISEAISMDPQQRLLLGQAM